MDSMKSISAGESSKEIFSETKLSDIELLKNKCKA